MPIAMIVHGGAWEIPDDQVEAHIAGCRAALAAGYQLLAAGASALDACEAAVRLMEDDPIFDAGTGSVLTRDGEVELDAALMDGRNLAYGAVAGLKHIRNPISLARRVLNGPATMLAGPAAEAFARNQGFAFCRNEELIVERERHLWQQWSAGQTAPVHGHDTVGAIALDAGGTLIAANSTGGTPFKLPGRIGDTPLIGCGLYADILAGACASTGKGEAITRVALARRGVEYLERGLPPQLAAGTAIKYMARRVPGGFGGCIILNPAGQVGLAWSTSRMAYAYRNAEGHERWGV
jgi:beta-aspartyl-peptidase (threonine type)